MYTGSMLSIIVPAYNEEDKIAATLQAIIDAMHAQKEDPFEIIVVDDGSTDRTAQLAEESAQKNAEIRVLRHKKNAGKGAAVRTGILASKGKYVLFLDVDLSTHPSAWVPFKVALAEGADLAIGSRRTAGAEVLAHQSWLREKLGQVFTVLTAVLLVKVSDVTCGFKAFRGEVARDLFSRQKIDGWSFDAEILYLAKRAGYRIQEIPVSWRDDPQTKVRLFHAVFGSLFDLLRIRFLHG